MDNNKILEMARKNKRRGREYESNQSIRSNLLGSAIAMVVGIILFLIEYFVKDSVNISLITVAMVALCVEFLYEGIKTKKLYLIAMGIIEAIIAVLSILVFVVQVIL